MKQFTWVELISEGEKTEVLLNLNHIVGYDMTVGVIKMVDGSRYFVPNERMETALKLTINSFTR